MRQTLEGRLVRLAGRAAAVPVLILLALSLLLMWRLDVRLTAALGADVADRLGSVTNGVVAMLEAQYESVQQTLVANLNVARDVVRRHGGLGTGGGAVLWQAKNQATGAIVPVALPRMQAGGSWLGQNGDTARVTPVVDEVVHLVGGTMTVFQRMNPAGDMLRVATNVVTREGDRAIGTFIPAQGADGTPNAVIAAVLKGTRYEGRAYVVDAWYQTVYEPISDGSGRVIGMLYVGVKQENIPSLRHSIRETRVGQTGGVVVLGGSGAQRGHFAISADGTLDGSDALTQVDVEGKPRYGALLDSALSGAPGSVAVRRYQARGAQGGAVPRIAAAGYFKPWDWVVVADAPEVEFAGARSAARTTLLLLIVGLLVAGGAVLAATLAHVRRAARAVTDPVRRLAETAERLAEGDLSGDATRDGDEELVRLADALQRTIVAERDLVATVESLARGNLDVTVTPRSERDALGRAAAGILAAERDVAEAAHRIAAGDLTSEVRMRGAEDRLGEAMNAILATERALAEAADRIAAGDLDVTVTARGAADRLSGAFSRIIAAERTLADGARRIAEGDLAVEVTPRSERDTLSLAFGRILEAERRLAEAAGRFAAGDLSSRVEPRGPDDALGHAFERLQETLGALLAELGRLTASARAGALDARGEADRFSGAFRTLVQGVNDLLEAAVAPIGEGAAVLQRIADRDLTARVLGDYRGDHATIKANLNRMADDLEQRIVAIAGTAETLGDASRQLSGVSEAVGSSVSRTSEEATTVSATAEQVSRSVQTVAQGTEEMTSAIREIARSASDAVRVAAQAVEVAETTNLTVERLGVSSAEIGEVIKVISGIAEQTNLLALNATIEAARAGEAGKGFSVVANEVKDLAKATAQATGEIGRRIEAIQGDTGAAVAAIRQIGAIIAEINTIQTTIAGAVEEQTATTNEMSRNITEAARGTREIAGSIGAVARAADASRDGAEAAGHSAARLAESAAELAALVAQFHYRRPGGGVPAAPSSPVPAGR